MTTMYKLVDQNFTTHNSMKWEIGVTNKATGSSNKMCTDGVLHCYASPEQAVIFNPIHAGIENPILMKIECSTILDTDGLKYCSKEQTPIEVLELPVFTTEQRIAFGIKCALLVCEEPEFVTWANAWLDGTDRTKESADAAESAADAESAAARSAAGSAAYAAYAAYADYADRSAAWSAAWSAWSADAAWSAAYATARSADEFKSKEDFAMELDKIIASL